MVLYYCFLISPDFMKNSEAYNSINEGHLLFFFSTMIVSGLFDSVVWSVTIANPTDSYILHYGIQLVAHFHIIQFPPYCSLNICLIRPTFITFLCHLIT